MVMNNCSTEQKNKSGYLFIQQCVAAHFFHYLRLKNTVAVLHHHHHHRRRVTVRHPPWSDMLMHNASRDNPSLLLEENVRSACSGQVGVICASCCQTTSKHSVTFEELRKDFYLHAKFKHGAKKQNHLSVLQRTEYIGG